MKYPGTPRAYRGILRSAAACRRIENDRTK